jgi:hypothetical protein
MLCSRWLPLGFASLLVLTLSPITPSLCIPPGDSPPATIDDINGHSFRLFGDDTKATVFFFLTDDCPIANSYGPEINRIAATYGPQKVAFFAVFTDPSISVSAIRQHAAVFDLHLPLIADRKHVLVRRAGATVTPEAAVFAAGGRLAYLGRIDDWYVDFGKRRSAPTQRYLCQALDAVLKGEPVAITRVPPIGCSITP